MVNLISISNGVCSNVLNPAIKPVVDLSIGLCFARLHIFAHFLHTGGKAVFFFALSAFCASWRNLSGLAPTSSVEFVTESVKVYKVRQDGFANFIVIKR